MLLRSVFAIVALATVNMAGAYAQTVSYTITNSSAQPVRVAVAYGNGTLVSSGWETIPSGGTYYIDKSWFDGLCLRVVHQGKEFKPTDPNTYKYYQFPTANSVLLDFQLTGTSTGGRTAYLEGVGGIAQVTTQARSQPLPESWELADYFRASSPGDYTLTVGP